MRRLHYNSPAHHYKLALPDLRVGRLAGNGFPSTEKAPPGPLSRSILSAANKEALWRTALAGEEANISYKRGALQYLHVQRVDHGIVLAEDAQILADFARRKILMDTYPI
jgi:adenosine deaminase